MRVRTEQDKEEEFAKWVKSRADKAGMTVDAFMEKDREYSKQRAREEAEAAELRDHRSTLDSLIKMEIPIRTWEAVNAGPSTTEALAGVSVDKDIIVLSGEPGRGKSVAAAAWLIIGFGRWISAGALARGYAYDQEAFSSLAKISRLVIDDLGTEYQDQKDRYLATLAEIIESRFANKKKTLITTNLGKDEFKARYGERLTSRIREDGAFVVCTGEDLRSKRSA